MGSRLGAVLAVLCLAALGGEALIYRTTHPKYETAVFDSPYVSFEYPSTWKKPELEVIKQHNAQIMWFAQHDVTDQSKRAQGFDGWWDKERDVSIWMDMEPAKSKPFDAKQHLIDAYREQHKRSFGEDKVIPPTLQPIKIAGHDAWMVNETYFPETLDIVFLTPAKLNPFKLAYDIALGGLMTKRTIVFGYKDRICHIDLILPGDKIARAKYERVYGRILDSLKIKDS